MLGDYAPSDWGIADKTEWVAEQPLEGEARMPALEGRDVVGFSEVASFAAGKMKTMPAHDGKPAHQVQRCPSGWYDDGRGTCRQGKAPQQAPSSPAQRMEQARKSGAWKGPTVKEESQEPPAQEPEPQPKPEPAAEPKPEPSEQKTKSLPSTEKATGASREIGDNFKIELTETNQQFLDKIKADGTWNGTEFVDLREVIGDQMSIAPRHLDAISRMLVTQGSDTTPWSKFGGDVKGGAGKIYAQAGELMTLAFSSLPAEQSKKLQSVIEQALAAQKANKVKNQIITNDWFQAAQNNSIAINHAISSNHGDNISVVGGAWDVKEEVEELGMKDYESEKGFSTDIYLKLSDGSLAQISLKKDTRVNFLNSGAGSYGKFIISAHAKNPSSPHYEEAQAYLKAIQTKESIANSLPPKTNAPRKKDGAEVVERWNNALETIRRIESEQWAQPDISYNNTVYSQQEETRLRDVLSSHSDQIKQFDLSSIDTDENSIRSSLYKGEGIREEELKLSKSDLKKLVKSGEISEEDKERILKAKDTSKELDKEAKSTASENKKLIEKANKTMKDKGLTWPELVDAITSQKVLNRDNRKLIHLAALNQNIDGYRDSVQTSHKAFVSAAIDAINNNPNMRDGMLEELKENFPIRDVAEGKEIMAIGDLSFNAETCRDIFGTTDFEVIKTGFKVAITDDGTPYLGWMGRAGDGPLLPLAKINVRQDGVGYGGGNIKHEMVLHPDFASRLRQSNAKEYGAGSGRTFSELEFEEMEKKKPTYEDYMEILRAKRASANSGEGANYADSMVFYRGKALGRCPAGTTRAGKTCVPGASATPQGPGYKQTDLGGLSRAQIQALSKAKSTEDIIKAHKKFNNNK